MSEAEFNLAIAEGILSAKGIEPKRFPRKLTKNRYLKLAKEVGLEPEDFNRLIQQKIQENWEMRKSSRK